jgi:DNA modification methylase
MVPPRLLKAAERNPRTHSKKQIFLVAQSIKRYGVINPVITDRHNSVVAGHARLEACRQLGLPFIPVIQIEHLSEAELRAYALADNALCDKSGWDRDLLAIELSELTDLLPAEGMDVSLTGFEAAEIDLLLADMAAARPEPEDVLPSLPPNPATRRGDLWLLGKHRLLCGDSREASNFIRLMNGTSAAAVFCDPPYNLRVKAIGGRGRIRHREFAFASGEMSSSQFRKFLDETLRHGIDVSAEGAVHFVCMDWRHISDLIEVGRDLYDEMLNLVVWNKSNAGQGSFYRSQHELIGVFRVGSHQHRNNVELGRFGRNRSNVWTYAGVNTFGRNRMEALAQHPTVKPVALVADALLDCTARGDAVLDQFAGSGTTILAAEKVGRVGFGIEYEPGYVDVAIKRWQKSTKLEATLAKDGRTFEEICAARSIAEASHA